MREPLANPDLSAFVGEDEDGLAGLVRCGVSRDADASPNVGEIHTLFAAAGRHGAERTEETWAHIPEVRYRRALP
jgi:hypothetical protein